MKAAPLQRLSTLLLPALVLATVAGLLWLQPANPALAQNEAKVRVSDGPTIVSSPQEGNSYAAGESIEIALTFTAPVTVTANEKNGGPRLRLNVGGKRRWAVYARSDQQGSRLIFSYAVKDKEKDVDGNGVSVPKNGLKLAGGLIEDGGDNPVKLKHPKLSNQSGHRVNSPPEQPNAAATPNRAPVFDSSLEIRFVTWVNQAKGAPLTASGTRLATSSGSRARSAILLATDADGDTLSYRLKDHPHASHFSVGNDGVLRIADDVLNVDAGSSYAVWIIASDGNGGEDRMMVEIDVLAEYMPVFATGPLATSSAQVADIDEAAAVGTVIHTMQRIDPYGHQLTYSIQLPDPRAEYVSIDNSGVVKVTKALSGLGRAGSRFELYIQATDTHGNTAYSKLRIYVKQ